MVKYIKKKKSSKKESKSPSTSVSSNNKVTASVHDTSDTTDKKYASKKELDEDLVSKACFSVVRVI